MQNERFYILINLVVVRRDDNFGVGRCHRCRVAVSLLLGRASVEGKLKLTSEC